MPHCKIFCPLENILGTFESLGNRPKYGFMAYGSQTSASVIFKIGWKGTPRLAFSRCLTAFKNKNREKAPIFRGLFKYSKVLLLLSEIEIETAVTA